MRMPGVYRGIVVNNLDPAKKGQLQLNIPQVLPSENGGQSYPVTDWCPPACPSDVLATLHIPVVGSVVWVMFEAGDPNYPVWLT